MLAHSLPTLAKTALLICFLATACVTPRTAERPSPQSQARPATAMSERDRMWRATVVVENGAGHGTGVIIGPGRILTAYHVVDEGLPEVEFFGGEKAAGVVSWVDPRLDLAVISAEVPARYQASSLFCGQLEKDQKLTTIGHPLTARWVLVEGSLRDDLDLGTLLPLSFDLSLGNSGGPVFDQAGRVVGIAAAILVMGRQQEIAAEPQGAEVGHHTGVGLMLPASRFCAELGGA